MLIPLFGKSILSKSANVTAQSRLNLYVEIPADQDRSPIVLYPTPGLTLFCDLSGLPIRGMYSRGSSLFVVQQASLFEIDSNGVATNRGATLGSNTGRVCMSDNGTQLFIVDSQKAYTYTYATTTLAEVTDADFPDGATTCTYLDGYSIVEEVGTQSFYISAVDDSTSWDALEFDTADQNPDDIVRVFADHGELLVFGDESTEFWANSGATDFPYSRLTSIETGLAAKWSVAKFETSVMFLAKNRLGNVQVVLLNGYTPMPVSTPDLDTLLNTYSVTNDATAFSYRENGHTFYQITFPAEGKSWLYDGTSGTWSELQSEGGRHRADLGVQFNGKTYVSDFESGIVYLLDPNTYTENGASIARQFVGRHIFKEDRQSIHSFWLDMETGVGLATGQGSDPQAVLRYSKDGGHSWSNELQAPIGAVGEYETRVKWDRLGRARDFTFEVTVTDPLKTVFINGYLKAS
jgi:hypothetical protein